MTDPLRQLSKIVFGQEHRLSVMLAIAKLPEDGMFTLTDLAEILGFRSASSLQDPLRALVAAGVLEKYERTPGERTRWYRRVDSPAWAWAADLSALATAESPNNPVSTHDVTVADSDAAK